MSEGRKRSRKSKLEVRASDEYEVVNEQSDETSPPLQKVSRTRLQVEYPDVPIIYDHDYCQRGSQSFAQPFPAILRPSQNIRLYNIDVEVQENRKRLYENTTKLLKIMASKSRAKVKKGKNIDDQIKICKYDPQMLLSMSREIASNSQNPADKLLDIEMRNLFGNILFTRNSVEPHETLLQMTFELWQGWFNTGRFIRDCPLFYQCHICNLAWWRLQPFREHIRTHDITNLRISLKENIHECMIIASNDAVKKLMFIDIDEDCWKCGKDVEFHKKSSEVYTCMRCKKTQYTCSAWRSHETRCLYSNISNHNIAKERQCTVCGQFIDSLDLVEKHMVLAHSVRSDVISPVTYKHCNNCNEKYFTYNTHNCPKSSKSSACQFCCRKFASKPLTTMHTQSPHNNHVVCRLCGKFIQMKCQEMEHLLIKHSQNYSLAYRCTLCTDECKMFVDESSISLHRINLHQKKLDKRRTYYELMLVPKQSLETYVLEERVQTGTTSGELLKTIRDNHVVLDEAEAKAIQVLSADIDVIVDEVDIKKERVYDENGEIDYEEMLRNMFGDTSKDTGLTDNENKETDDSENDTKENIIMYSDDGKINEEKTENFDFDIVKVKTEPTDIDIIENPIETQIEIVEVKSEPVDYEEVNEEIEDHNQINEEMEDQNQVNEEIVDHNQIINDIEDHNQTNNEIDDHNQIDNEVEKQNQIDTKVKVQNQIKSEVKNQNQIKNEVKNQNQIKNEVEDKIQIKNEVDSLTVKVEPDINMDDIASGNIIIKRENNSDDEITTDTIPLDQLLKFNTDGDMDWVSEELNPDEITFDVLSPSGLYKRKKIYACHKCGYTAQYKHYSLHVSSGCAVSPKMNESHPCSKCGLTFVMFRNYVLHFDKHGYSPMSCPKCGDTFDQQVKLLSHVQKHIKNNFVGLHVLHRGGEETSKANKEVKCQECRNAVPHSDMFRHWEAHLTFNTQQETTSDVPDCRVKEEQAEYTVDCERVTMNTKILEPNTLKQALDSLQSTSLAEKTCSVCYRAFARRCDAKRHIVEHLLMDAHVQKVNNKGFRCQICGECYPRQEQYKFHMREHGSMPIFKCDICNKTFSDSSNFAKHKKIHGVRVLVCDTCKKKFHSKSALQKHVLEHSVMKQFQCPYCASSFSLKRELKQHKHRFHSKYKCVLCDLTFESLQFKWNHDWEVHKERKHKADCPVCGKSFRKLQDVKKHAQIEHRVHIPYKIKIKSQA